MHRSIRRSLRRAAAVAVTMVTALLIAPPALAGEVSVRDARGDMWVIEEGSTDPDPAPSARIGDFVRTTFRHTNTRVLVRSKFVELERTGRRFVTWTNLQARNGRRWFAGVELTPRDRNGRTLLFTGTGVDITCNLRHRVNYRQDTVHLSIPRRCLNTPRALRFGQLSEFSERTLRFARLDDSLSRQVKRVTWTDWVRRG
jgi:hypothetical protein